MQKNKIDVAAVATVRLSLTTKMRRSHRLLPSPAKAVNNNLQRTLKLRRNLSSAADTVTVTIAEAQATTKAALKMIGWDDEDAGLQAEIMTAAELCGNNQGLVKMYQPALMAPAPAQHVDLLRSARLLCGAHGQAGCDRHRSRQLARVCRGRRRR